MTVFRYAHTVGWEDCDASGYCFFPNYFRLFHRVMEAWFEAELGVPYAEFVAQKQLAVPVVHLSSDFGRPCRFGECTTVSLSVARIGRTSMELQYGVTVGDEPEPRLTGRTVHALMDLNQNNPTAGRAVPWPEELKTEMERFA